MILTRRRTSFKHNPYAPLGRRLSTLLLLTPHVKAHQNATANTRGDHSKETRAQKIFGDVIKTPMALSNTTQPPNSSRPLPRNLNTLLDPYLTPPKPHHSLSSLTNTTSPIPSNTKTETHRLSNQNPPSQNTQTSKPLYHHTPEPQPPQKAQTLLPTPQRRTPSRLVSSRHQRSRNHTIFLQWSGHRYDTSATAANLKGVVSRFPDIKPQGLSATTVLVQKLLQAPSPSRSEFLGREEHGVSAPGGVFFFFFDYPMLRRSMRAAGLAGKGQEQRGQRRTAELEPR